MRTHMQNGATIAARLRRGFTLMELLVVIAIIGLLAAVVLASLNTARQRGADAAAKSNLNNARAQAALYYEDNDEDYADVCTDADGIVDMVTAAGATCNDGDGSAWAAFVQLSNEDYYCVDSEGFGGEVESVASSTTACN